MLVVQEHTATCVPKRSGKAPPTLARIVVSMSNSGTMKLLLDTAPAMAGQVEIDLGAPDLEPWGSTADLKPHHMSVQVAGPGGQQWQDMSES